MYERARGKAVEKRALEQQLTAMQAQEAEAQLQARHLAEITGTQPSARRPKTAAEVLEACGDELDDELEGLFRRNAESLATQERKQHRSLLGDAKSASSTASLLGDASTHAERSLAEHTTAHHARPQLTDRGAPGRGARASRRWR